MVYTKTVQIHCNDLGKSVTWMFCFLNPPDNKIFKEYFPLAWRVVTIPAEGAQTITLTYTSEPVLTKAQKLVGNRITAATWRPCDPGYKTNLQGNDLDGYSFSKPKDVGGDTAIAINDTESVQPMGVGFMDDGQPSTVLYFDSVGVKDEIVAKFTAVLKAFTMSDYKQTEILKASVQSSVPRWTINMAEAGAPTQYNMNYNSQTGVFEIKPRT